jgi:hypothetical protein
MSEHAEDKHAISLSELDQETLELGTIARLLASPSDLFLYTLMNITPACYRDPVARRVFSGVVQGILSSYTHRASIPVEKLNFGDTDALAIGLIRRAVAGGYPCMHSLAPCLLELHDRCMLAQLEDEMELDQEWERISQEYVPDDDSDDMPG